MKHALLAVLVFFVVGSALGQSPAKVRITTWNLEWFPNGSPHEATPEKQAQRIQAAADVLKKLNPDILLLQEVRDYDACARLGDAIQPGVYTVVVCSAFKGGKQQEAIMAKIPAQAEWSESWKSMEGIDPPRGFAFAWFKIGSADIGSSVNFFTQPQTANSTNLAGGFRPRYGRGNDEIRSDYACAQRGDVY